MSKIFKLSLLFISLILVISSLTFPALLSSADEGAVFFVAQTSGSDEGNGSLSTPYKTLSKAIRSAANGGTVVIIEKLDITKEATAFKTIKAFSEPSHKGEIKITSLYNGIDYREKGAHITYSGDSGYFLSGNTVFDSVKFVSQGKALYISARGNEVRFGGDISTVDAGNKDSMFLQVMGGYYYPDKTAKTDASSKITVESGSFKRIFGFSLGKGDGGTLRQTGHSEINIYGGRVEKLYGGSALNHYSGTADISVYGGSVGELYAGGDATRPINGANISVYGGKITSLNINNVKENASLDVRDGTVSAASVTYYNEGLKAEAAGSVKTLRYNVLKIKNSALYKGFDSTEPYAVAYVEKGKNGDGRSESSPTSDINSALSLLKGHEAILVIKGTYTASSDISAPNEIKSLNITGDRLDLSGSTLTLPFPCTVSEIDLINCNIKGETLDISCETEAANTVEAEKLTLHGGTWSNITAKGNAEIALDGVTTEKLVISGENSVCELSDCKITELSLSGNIALSAFGGSVAEIKGSINKASSSLAIAGTELSSRAEAALNSLFGELEKDSAIYVSSDGKKDNNGVSPKNATTLQNAFELLKETGGKIVITDNVYVGSAALPHAEKEIVITSLFSGKDHRDAGAGLSIISLSLNSAVRFENITFFPASGNAAIYSQGNKTVYGEGVSSQLKGDITQHISLFGGAATGASCKETELVIYDGEYHNIIGGGNDSAAAVSSPTYSITINGGTVYGSVFASGNGSSTRAEASVTVNGGTLYGGIFGISGDSSSYGGKIDISVNGGMLYSMIAPAMLRNTLFSNLTYTVNINGGDLSHLTDIYGGELFKGRISSEINIDKSIDIEKEESGSITFQNPIMKSADPRAIWHNNAYYYIATSGSVLYVYKITDICDLEHSVGIKVWSTSDGGSAVKAIPRNIWPSGFIYFSEEEVGEELAGVYLYMSSDKDGDTDARRMYVLKAATDDLQGDYINPVTGEKNIPVFFSSDTEDWVNKSSWTAGVMYAKINGEKYLLWVNQSGRDTKDFHQTIHIAKMKDPWTVTGKSMELVNPEYDWECEGYAYSKEEDLWYPKVVEGIKPVYGDNGEVYITYAASGYWTTGYAIGQMKYLGGEVLDIKNWEKSKTPIFKKNAEANGTGGITFITSPDGTERWFLYHAYIGATTLGGRYCFFDRYTVDGNGVHMGSGTPAPLTTEFTIKKNPLPLAEKISGFDNYKGGNNESPDIETPDTTVSDDSTTAITPPDTSAPNEGGCSGSISFAMILPILAMGATAVKRKKNKE